MTFGENFSRLRKNAGFTQEEVAVNLGVSPQAVSKWENDLSCPDIMLLSKIAKLYNVTVDALLDEHESEELKPIAELKTDEAYNDKGKSRFKQNLLNRISLKKQKPAGKVFLKINIVSVNNDDVNIKIPFSLFKLAKGVLGAVKINRPDEGSDIDLSKIDVDFDEIVAMVESGVEGEIVNITTQHGETVKIYVDVE